MNDEKNWLEDLCEMIMEDREEDDYTPEIKVVIYSQDEPVCPKCNHNNAMLLGSDLIRECRDCHYREEEVKE